jgi:hypothetical protein
MEGGNALSLNKNQKKEKSWKAKKPVSLQLMNTLWHSQRKYKKY